MLLISARNKSVKETKGSEETKAFAFEAGDSESDGREPDVRIIVSLS